MTAKIEFLSTLILLSLFLASCSNLKPALPNEQRLPSLKNRIYQLNGDYQIVSVDTSYRTLAYALLMNGDSNFSNFPNSNEFINLKVIDNKHIQVFLFKGDSLAVSKVLRGKIKDDYFVFNAVGKWPIFWVILNGYSDQKTRIGILKNENLTVDSAGFGCALLILFPILCSEASAFGLEFRKIKKENQHN